MNILAIDTSGPIAGVCVLKDGEIGYEAAAVNRMTHSVSLMPMVEQALSLSGTALADIDLLACTVGPGSFTGVRIGVSTLKGLAHGLGKPCVPVDALEALAAGVSLADAVLCPIQDARAGQVYGAAFAGGIPPKRLLSDMAIKLEDYVEQIKPLGERFVFVGDGVKPHRERLAQLLADRAVFPPAGASYLRPSSVALLGQAHSDQQLDYLSLKPLYLRAPQAERARLAKGEPIHA